LFRLWGDVTPAHLIGSGSREVAHQQVGGNRYIVLAAGGDHELSLASGIDAVLLHHAPHALLTHSDAACHHFVPQLGPVVLAPDFGVDGPHVRQQGFVADAPVRAWLGGFVRHLATQLRKVANGVDFEQVAHH
jgi:hypothetical protein